MAEKYVLAVDQGTSGTKAVVFDEAGTIVARATAALKSSFPRPGYVEQDPEEIYQSVLDAVGAAVADLAAAGREISDIACCGISNQRETLVLWDEQGKPLCPAVVWQCKRSVDICQRLADEGLAGDVAERTGLIIDPYFSGTKLIWLHENDPAVREAIEAGKAFFGTVDSWLLYRLAGGKYMTDHTNASRTLLFNIGTLDWDSDLLKAFALDKLRLPEVAPSSHSFGETAFEKVLPGAIPITGMIGDSHAAAFGEGCFTPGTAKATMGTGCSVLLNTGEKRITSKQGMMTAICWSIEGRLDYALEGVIVTCGATINWLRDELGLFADSSETADMATSVEDTGGVTLIPAFAGLGAPWWRMDARAALTGLTFGSTKNHIVRAALESIPCQIKDVIAAMEQDSGLALSELKVDGGLTANTFVVQSLADMLGCAVANIGIEEVSALGAAYMAGLKAGVWADIEALSKLTTSKKEYKPGEDRSAAVNAHARWLEAVKKML